MDLDVGPGDLLVFVDETGDTVVGPGKSPLFGFGAVVIWQPDYNQHQSAWREVKRALLGDPLAPIHAADIPPSELPRFGAAIGDFFRAASFRRLATTQAMTARLDAPVPVYDSVLTVFLSLLVRHFRLACDLRGELANRLVIIFEHSDKLFPLQQKLSAGIGLGAAIGGGEELQIPIAWGAFRKSAGEDGLEWADMVAQAAFRGSRARMQGKAYGKDFLAVFPPGNLLGEWREVTSTTPNAILCRDAWGGPLWAASGGLRLDYHQGGSWLALLPTSTLVYLRRPVRVLTE